MDEWITYIEKEKRKENILGHYKNIPEKLILLIPMYVILDLKISFFDLSTCGVMI